MGISNTQKSASTSGVQKILDQVHSGSGIVSPARYEISIGALPISHLDMGEQPVSNSEVARRLSISCEGAQFLGRNISTQPNRIAGPIREMAYESLYSGDLDLTFRVGQDMLERRVFEGWMDSIVGHNRHSISYYDSYVRDIEIKQLGKDDSVLYRMIVRECFPKTINPIDLGYDKTDEYMRIQVSMSFREYEIDEYVTQNMSSDIMSDAHREYRKHTHSGHLASP